MSLQVEVKLYGALRDYRPPGDGAPHHPFSLTLPPATSVTTVLERLSIPEGLVNIISVNGETAVPAHTLHDGDQIRLFPPTAGG
jgi:sulfur carrier protein ThiS